jgi:hypothetical protein
MISFLHGTSVCSIFVIDVAKEQMLQFVKIFKIFWIKYG